ncbi:MAG: tetratricopeptide repeat protein, partial [Saprospiraceae bacterium]
MNFKHAILALTFLLATLVTSAQETTVFTDANRFYKQGMEFFDQGLYGKAQRSFLNTIQLLAPVNESTSDLLGTKAELKYAQSAVRLGLPDGEKLMLDFIRKYSPEPVANSALIELANFYYNDKDYEKAVEYFSQIPSYNLSQEQRSEVKFKLGYAHFVQKKFKEAKQNFNQIKAVQNDYFYPTNYYLGLVHFFEGDYDDAVKSFKMVEKSRKYSKQIPYYLTQIYFAERRYDELLDYALPKLKNSGIRKTKEISQLVGQAYFEKGLYAEALPYLERYAQSGKLRAEEFYQLAFTQLQTGNYQKAIRNFEELTEADSKLGQNALFNLGNLYLQTNNKSSARNAFGVASRMEYDKNVQEESLFNYAKLSYELKFEPDAVAALQAIKPGTKYYNDAQTLLGNVFLNTRDYARAMKIIEEVPNKTPQLREAYQKVTYFRGVQEYNNGNLEEAERLFQKSLESPIDATVKTLAIYWQGEIAHDKNEYGKSIQLTNQFLTLAKTLNTLPDEASIHTANYRNGYNYLKQENYNTALGYFQDAAAGIKRNASFIRNDYVKQQVLGDATVRAGDSYFKRNDYNDAIRFYDEAVDRRYPGYVYALYQKAVIEGLRGNRTDKLLALESISTNYPNSQFADEALYQQAIVYQEIGQLNKAILPLKTIINQYRGKTDLTNQALLRLGLISYNQGNLQQAISYYKQVFSNNPKPAEAQSALTALEEIYVNDLGQADDYFAFLETIPGYKVDNLEKDNVTFRSAEVQYENGNYDRAVQGYTDYLRKYPSGANSLLAIYRRGDSYALLKQYSNAIKDYEAVINRGPSTYYVRAIEKAAIIAYNHELNFPKAYNLYSRLEEVATTDEMRFDAQIGALRAAYRAGNQ